MTNLLVILHSILVISFTLRILLRDDLSPPARLAWFIILNVLPYAGSAASFLFGEVDLGRRAHKRHKVIFDALKAKAAPVFGDAASTQLIEPIYKPAFRTAASINGFNPVPGNRAKLMADGADTNSHLIADIDAATDHVHILSYIWLTDTTGTDIARALIRALGTL